MTNEPTFTANDQHALQVLRKFLDARTRFETVQQKLQEMNNKGLIPYPTPRKGLMGEAKALCDEIDRLREQLFAYERVLLAWHSGENVVLARLAIP
ncbi:hypothetical protein [Methylobacterium sp. SD21]|uniref:hypothetical protein n=1 Tax=Methylobacterium litchii TaxID=3138810 RepID=UPI00313C7DAA